MKDKTDTTIDTLDPTLDTDATPAERDAMRQRREAEKDRDDAARDRAAGRPVSALGNEIAAKGNDAAASVDSARASRDRASASRPDAGKEWPGTSAAYHDGSPLLGDEHCRRFRARWETVLASFIDEPRKAVADADGLVREATQEIHSVFERDRRQLEGIWDRGDQVSTEDLRVTLQRYRSFFERLLSL
jgi:hypothetical protein